MSVLQNGAPAPDFSLLDTRNNQWRLRDRKGKMVILHFCRGEYCPTTQGEFPYWSNFNHLFGKMNCELVFLVNGGREEHTRFHEQFRLRAPLLIDEDGAVGLSYGVYGVNSRDKKRDDYKNYTAPSIFLIDALGNLACSWILSGPRGRPSPETLLGILTYAQHNNWQY